MCHLLSNKKSWSSRKSLDLGLGLERQGLGLEQQGLGFGLGLGLDKKVLVIALLGLVLGLEGPGLGLVLGLWIVALTTTLLHRSIGLGWVEIIKSQLGWGGLGQPVDGLGWIGSHKMDPWTTLITTSQVVFIISFTITSLRYSRNCISLHRVVLFRAV